MQRRDLMRWLAAAGAAGAASTAEAQREDPDVGDLGDAPIDPYFLDSGALSDAERDAIVEVEEIRARGLDGRSVVIPRGLKPARAPSYRLVYWMGGIGDPSGRFVSPLAVRPALGPRRSSRYRFNGQILGLHGATTEWRGGDDGTLTVELRASLGGQQMTWFFGQPFTLDAAGRADIGFQYIAQRKETPEPVTSDQASLGLRVQLMRSPRRGALLFRRILRIALTLSGVPLPSEREARQALQALPALRVPAMFDEAAALVQAVLGSLGEASPIWRGAFTPYGIAEGGSQLNLAPGHWLVIDAERELDLRNVVLEDVGGQLAPVRNGAPLDVNYLVLALEIDEGPAPVFLRSCSGEAPQSLAVPR